MYHQRNIYFPTIAKLDPEEANNYPETYFGLAVYRSRQDNPALNVVKDGFYRVDENKNHIPFPLAEVDISIGAPTDAPGPNDPIISVDPETGAIYTFENTTNTWVLSGGIINIYNSDGTLTGNRVLSGDGNSLSFVDVSLFECEGTVRIVDLPATDDTNTQILTRNATTGNIEIRTAASLISGSDTNFALNDLTFSANRVHTLGTFNLTLNGTASANSSINFNIDNINLNDNVRTKVRTKLNIQTAPAANTTATKVLVRDSGTGDVQELTIEDLLDSWQLGITDGTTTDAIFDGDTITFTENAASGVLGLVVSPNTVTFTVNTTGASNGDYLSLQAGALAFTASPDINIYEDDGTLTANRILTGNNFNLTFTDINRLLTRANYTTIRSEIGMFVLTPNVNASIATAGQYLRLINATTGEVEFDTVSGGGGGGGGAGTVTIFSANNLSPLFTTSVANASTTPTLSFVLSNAAANTYFGNSTGSSTAPSYITAGALTKVDDTNVTLTLGGDPSVSLLKAASLTLGWTGTLGVARGGTNIGSYTAGDILYATGATTLAKLPVGTNGDVLTLVTGLPAWVAGGGGGYTDEQAQDAINAMLIDTNTINFTYTDATPELKFDVITQMSVTSDASGVKLVNDATTPLLLQHYGTDISAAKGWFNDFLQYDSSESVWSPYLVTHASKNIGGGFAENILIGKAAGQGLTTGHRITIVGSGSNGFSLDDAEYVSIFGYANALGNANGYGSTLIGSLNDDTTSGTFNTIVGYNNLLSVLGNNGTASSNTIVGYGNAVELSGNGNVILGYENLTVGTSVADSIMIGHNNGQGITTSDGIIIIGSNSGNGAALGIRNIIVGTDTAPASTGSENVIIGSNAATLATTAFRNTLIGSSVGTALTTGTLNIFIGRGSGSSVSTGSSNIFIGTGASADVSNSILIGANQNLNSSNIIGIGNGATDVYLGQNPFSTLSSLIYHGPRGQDAGTTDTAGNNWTFKGGAGSGTGLPGKIIFQTSDPIASGITVQTLTDTLSVEGSFVHIEKGLGLKTEVSSATSLTLDAKSVYVFTGSSATTWTLPAVSGNTDRTYLIKNRGTAIITLTRAGSDNIYVTGTVTTYEIHPGDAYQVINDGTYWLIL